MATYTLTAADLKDKLVLDNTLAPKRLVFTDETVYGTGGVVPITNRYRVFRITVNGVVIQDANFRTTTNVADWSGAGDSDMEATSTDFSSVAIPLNTDGTIVNGSYKIEINTLFLNNDVANTYSLLQSVIAFNISYTKPTAKLTGSVDLGLTPEITWVDGTSYVVDNVTPTNSRLLSYFNPLGNTVTQTTGSSLVSNTVYTGTCSATLSNTITYDFSTKLDNSVVSTYPSANFTTFVKDTIYKRAELLVEGDGTLCGAYCCVQSIKEDYDKFIAKGNYSQAQLVWDKFQKASSLLSFAALSVRCGKTSGLNDILLEIKDLADCNDDCGCGDGSPQLIPNLGSVNRENKVVIFDTGTGAANVPITFDSGNGTFLRDNGSSVSTMSYIDFNGLDFNQSKRDFDVYFDGNIDTNGSFNSSTNLYTFSTQLSTKVTVMIKFNY